MELVPNSRASLRSNAGWPKEPANQYHSNYPSTAYCDDSYAMAALEFVRTQAQQFRRTGQPFHGLLAVQIPHAPFDEITKLPDWDREYVGDPLFEKLSPQSQQWAAMVTRIDSHFGNILDALEDPNGDGDHADSVADETLVVFKSDNGGPGGKSLQELGSNANLRGTKGTIYEGGIRVPLLMRWPAKIHEDAKLKPGSICRRPLDVTDLLPTFCELAGVKVPLGIDGVSIAPLLTGSGIQRDREYLIHEAGKHSSIIRGRFKLIRAKRGGQMTLFDLQEDPSEETDLAGTRQDLVDELEQLLFGERVEEPKGFANTYHRWIGGHEAITSDPGNWSDYRYENAGITYLQDNGPPRLSWIATIQASDEASSIARVDGSLECLGIEVAGNPDQNAFQTLEVPKGTSVLGRNEIRIGSGGRILLRSGKLESLRSIDVHAGGALVGDGIVDADLSNSGTLNVSSDPIDRLHVFDRPLPLDNGGAIPDVRIAYTTEGVLNAERSNAVLICHALTGDQYVVGLHPVTGKPGWWSTVVGPG
ncbi:MAG: sulfatase/phosphatase domain-containing protein, partial [Planctomycetota bacterium]